MSICRIRYCMHFEKYVEEGVYTHWTGLDWTGLEWSGVDWSGVEWSGVEWSTGLANLSTHILRE